MSKRSLERVGRDVAGKDIRRIEVAIAADTPAAIRQLALDPFLDWLATYAKTARFRDGQTLQLGWTLLSCRVADGRLTLLAPDMKSFPIEFAPDLSQAVWTMFKHVEVPASFGEEPLIPTLQQAAVVGARYQELPCLMERSPPDGDDDSGWTFNSMRPDVDNNDPSQLGRVSLYEAALENPHLLRYLSLPPGYTVVFQPERSRTAVHYRQRRLVRPTPGSYLAMTLEAEEGA